LLQENFPNAWKEVETEVIRSLNNFFTLRMQWVFTFMLLLNPTTPCLDAQYVGEDSIGTIPNTGEEFFFM